eukprot:5241652-Pyramimonas_sp.AAC.1
MAGFPVAGGAVAAQPVEQRAGRGGGRAGGGGAIRGHAAVQALLHPQEGPPQEDRRREHLRVVGPQRRARHRQQGRRGECETRRDIAVSSVQTARPSYSYAG